MDDLCGVNVDSSLSSHPETADPTSILPTPLARELLAMRDVRDDPGAVVRDVWETFLQLTAALGLCAYLRDGRPRASVNHMLFEAVGRPRNVAAVWFLDALVESGGLAGEGIAGRLGDAWRRTRELRSEQGVPVVAELNEHARQVRHVLSVSAEGPRRTQLVERVMQLWGEFYENVHVVGSAGDGTRAFRGLVPKQVDDRSGPAGVWLESPGEPELPLSAMLSVRAGSPEPELSTPDDDAVAERLGPALEASPSLEDLYRRYCDEREGRFQFPPLPEPPHAPTEVVERHIAELADGFKTGRAVLVFHPPGYGFAATWAAETLGTEYTRVLHCALAHSPVALRDRSLARWIWHSAVSRGEDEAPSQRAKEKQLLAATSQRLLERDERVLFVLTDLQLVLNARGWGENLSDRFLRSLLSTPGLHVVGFSEPVSPIEADPFLRQFWSPEVFDAPADPLDAAAAEALIERLAAEPEARRLLELVACHPEPLDLHDLAVALERPTPRVFHEVGRMAPLWRCPRGLVDLEEGFRELSLASETVRRVVREAVPDEAELRSRLQEVVERRQREEGRRETMLAREIAPRRERSGS